MIQFETKLLKLNTIILFYLWHYTRCMLVGRAGLGKCLLTHVEFSVEFASFSNKMFVFVTELLNAII